VELTEAELEAMIAAEMARRETQESPTPGNAQEEAFGQ
jgi:hypothetical protein